ncbi:hypothetical protein [Xanthomonas fragariae]|uniref:hypothetical protein n=1 Tax=Xanthomonas fragariae TaxID=48664 RepID=UPI0022AB1BB8|nr:hypothetical protein [Xanthomonas fragariae]WAT13601.1 hypothetical protein OZ429_10380 [Xanthomonas fragariae]
MPIPNTGRARLAVSAVVLLAALKAERRTVVSGVVRRNPRNFRHLHIPSLATSAFKSRVGRHRQNSQEFSQVAADPRLRMNPCWPSDRGTTALLRFNVQIFQNQFIASGVQAKINGQEWATPVILSWLL